MNILFDKLPNKVRIGSEVVEINTDFRAGVEFEALVERGETRTSALLRPFYRNGIPKDVAGAAEAALWFYRCGAEKREETAKEAFVSNKQAYSFDIDADAIFADFRRFYSIDLSVERLHWFVFRALLAGLPDDSDFKRRIYYRTCDLKGMSKKERERITKIRAQIQIKTETGAKLTIEERNARMLAYVKKRTTETKSEVN